MFNRLVDSVQSLYLQERLWKLLAELTGSAIIALILLAVFNSMLGSSKPKQTFSNTASYQPTVPPSAFGSNGSGSRGNVVTMQMTRQDRESDERLKTLHVSALNLSKKLSPVQRGEQLVQLVKPISAYDRQRAKTVHLNILAEADRYAPLIAASNKRLEALRYFAGLYQQNADSKSTIGLAGSYSQVRDFDKQRSVFPQYESYHLLGKTAEAKKQDSDGRLNELKTIVSSYLANITLDAESQVISRLNSLLAFDKNRPEIHYRDTITSASKIASASRQREIDSAEMEKFLDSGDLTPEMMEPLSLVISRMHSTYPSLLTKKQKKQLKKIERLSSDYQKSRLIQLSRLCEKDNSLMNQHNLYLQLTRMEQDYPKELQRIDHSILNFAMAIKDGLLSSDLRLQNLLSSGQALSAKMSQRNVDNLLSAQKKLEPFDYKRMSKNHKQALALADKAKSGILESDQHINNFMYAFNVYQKNGCSKEILRNLRVVKNQLTQFDVDRMDANVLNALSSASQYLKRSYCMESSNRSFKPVN